LYDNVTDLTSCFVYRFIDEKRIPRSLVVRINAYYKNEKDDSYGNNEVIAGLPDVIRTDVNYFVYGQIIIDAFAGKFISNIVWVISMTSCFVYRDGYAQ
jgi:hypothetical protein